jgi:LacI family transcriptional regulator, repressor for deo operon, udp, cdd, tsx, nupC, and nupG
MLVNSARKDLGHKQVGFIGGTGGLATSARRTSFPDAVVKHGLSILEEWMVEGDFRIEGGSAAMARILSQSEYPSAIAAANDHRS